MSQNNFLVKYLFEILLRVERNDGGGDGGEEASNEEWNRERTTAAHFPCANISDCIVLSSIGKFIGSVCFISCVKSLAFVVIKAARNSAHFFSLSFVFVIWRACMSAFALNWVQKVLLSLRIYLCNDDFGAHIPYYATARVCLNEAMTNGHHHHHPVKVEKNMALMKALCAKSLCVHHWPADRLPVYDAIIDYKCIASNFHMTYYYLLSASIEYICSAPKIMFNSKP